MAARRGKGEGSVFRDASGRWVAMVEAGRDPATGKRQRRKVTGKTKAEVLRRGAEVRKQVDAGMATGGATTTVATFARRWLSTVVEARVDSPNTVANYRAVIETHVIPGLGAIPLAKLTPEAVDGWLAAKAKRYSQSYVSRMRSVLADMLTHAERRGMVTRNAARLAVMPRCKPKTERRSLTAEEGRRLLDAARGHRLEALIAVGLTLGLRPGELAGLLWDDIDLAGGTLTVSGSMKRMPDSTLVRGPVKRSSNGRRTIAMPAPTAALLREHRAAQAAERLQLGGAWHDHGLVFCSEWGTPLDPSNLRRTFTAIAVRAGLDQRFPYLLRHTAASLLVDAGAGIEAVADVLGDDPRTLYRHYRHRTRPVADAAAGPMEALFG